MSRFFSEKYKELKPYQTFKIHIHIHYNDNCKKLRQERGKGSRSDAYR